MLAVVVASIGTASAQTLTTIHDTGPSDNRIDIVVLGDGYTQAELPKYASDVDRFMDGFFDQEPFREYQNYFNVHRIDIVSSESGADHPSRNPSVFKNTALDGTYDCGGIQRATCVNISKVNAILSGVQPDMRDLVLVILNDPEYRRYRRRRGGRLDSSRRRRGDPARNGAHARTARRRVRRPAATGL